MPGQNLGYFRLDFLPETTDFLTGDFLILDFLTFDFLTLLLPHIIL
jgi:hypothetical protein